ncbi:MAG: hypothetical protein ACRD0P_17595 [Stackebrandtia sp.]
MTERVTVVGDGSTGDGIEPPTVDGVLGWLADQTGQAWALVLAHIMVAVPLVLLVGTVVFLVVDGRRQRERAAVAGASWWQVRPPKTLPDDGALPVWNGLARLLDGRRMRRSRIAAEMFADPAGGVRLGFWIPGNVPEAAVLKAVGVAWPGSQLERVDGPHFDRYEQVGAAEVRPCGDVWSPLLDHRTRATRGAVAAVNEGLRAVWAELAAEGDSGRTASVQVVVSRSRPDRSRSGASIGGGGLSGISVGDVLGFVGRMLGTALVAVLEFIMEAISDLITPGPSTATSRAQGRTSPPRSASARPPRLPDPVQAEREKAALAKRLARPHLRATVRVAIAGDADRRALGEQAQAVANGLIAIGLDPAAATARPVRFGCRRIHARRHGKGFVASCRELAAMWHLPSQPGEHGIDAPRADYAAPQTSLPDAPALPGYQPPRRPQPGLHQWPPAQPNRPARPPRPGQPYQWPARPYQRPGQPSTPRQSGRSRRDRFGGRDAA